MAHKGMQVGNKMYDVLYLFGDNLDSLLVVPSLLTEMVEEDSNGQHDDDVELLRSFETS